jgi:hypothetical protein
MFHSPSLPLPGASKFPQPSKVSLTLSLSGSSAPSPSKYKIGESFRKLMGRLRSASSERRGKRSTSQLTQTEDEGGSTYLQYNSVDRNVPLGPDYEHTEDRPPERPARSPRESKGSSSYQPSGGGGGGGSGVASTAGRRATGTASRTPRGTAPETSRWRTGNAAARRTRILCLSLPLFLFIYLTDVGRSVQRVAAIPTPRARSLFPILL